jgi:hypothetical protein
MNKPERPNILEQFMRRRSAEEVVSRDLHDRDTHPLFQARDYVQALYAEREQELRELEATDLRAAALNDDREAMSGVLLRQAALQEVLSELKQVVQEITWRLDTQRMRCHLQGLKAAEVAKAQAQAALSVPIPGVRR